MRHLVQAALFLFATIDPLGTVLLFSAVTAGIAPAERHAIARRAVVSAGAILVGAMVLGQPILQGLGVRLISLQVAGGLILFLFGLQMIFGEVGAPGRNQPESGHDVAVFPLAVPAIASPGAVIAVIVLTDNDVYSLASQATIGAILLAILLLTWAMLRLAGPILSVLGVSGSRVLIRVLGMLLAALAVELTLSALGVAGWTGPA
ncbi:MAG TPA: MarC family protein [Gemmatimonadales bacterium]|nr:MarC family protein [Gemmatimonadales bacterium]